MNHDDREHEQDEQEARGRPRRRGHDGPRAGRERSDFRSPSYRDPDNRNEARKQGTDDDGPRAAPGVGYRERELGGRLNSSNLDSRQDQGSRNWESARAEPRRTRRGSAPSRSGAPRGGGPRHESRDVEERSLRGVGPRNYTRSDERIREDICERLTSHPVIDASDVEVKVSDCEVTLEGSVNQRRIKHMIEDIADDCAGVRCVENRIRVGARRQQEPNDAR